MSYNYFDGYKAKKFEVTEDFKAGDIQILPGDKMVKSKVVAISFDSEGLDEGVELLKLSAGEVLLDLNCRVTTAWDSTTNEISIGYGNDYDELVDGEDIKSTGLVDRVSGSMPTALSGDEMVVKAKVDSTGDDATEGKAEVVMIYTC